MSYIYNIPVPSQHVGIAIGKNFSTLKKNGARFKVNIHFNKAEPENNRPMPYFVVRGQEKNVHQCTIEIQRLVMISMTNENKVLKANLGYSGTYDAIGVNDSNTPVSPKSPTTLCSPKTPDYSPPEIMMAPVPVNKKNTKVTFVTN